MVGCNQIAGIREGIPRDEEVVACSTVDDCSVAEPECRAAVACEQGSCIFDDAIDGTPLREQIEGDCAQVVCDGAGKTKLVPLESDAPDDSNVCTLDTCEGTLPRHTSQGELPCYSGPRATKGKGICKDGLQRCDEAGNPVGGCEGEVLPQAETCVSLFDEDCDGEVNEEGEACVCRPGTIERCYTGPQGTEGVGVCKGGTWTCTTDGRAWGACLGERTPERETCDAAEADEDCDREVNEEGEACVCQPGAIEQCYTGPKGTEGVGVCKGGMRSCNTDGRAWGACLGERTPERETCDAAETDEDCDGKVNEEGEACVCQPGATEQCYTGPQGTAGVGECAGGTRNCNTDGRAWSACLGERTPEAETCDAGETDEDCDGEVNEEGADCRCGDGYVSNGEECDDNNTSSADTCAECVIQQPVQVATGTYHTCADIGRGKLKCWGSNDSGQLGLGDTGNRGDQTAEMGANLPIVNLGVGAAAVVIAAGNNHTCARLSDSSVKCWGSNDSGQLGLGRSDAYVGRAASDMGDSLPPVNLGTGKTAVTITAGDYHTCAILNDSSVKCWGYNNYGQLGLGRNNTNMGRSASDMGDSLPPVNLGTGKTAVAIAAGGSHTCALLNDSSVKCWGYNNYGQLGLGLASTYVGRAASEMGDSLPPVNLGTGKTAVAIAAGGSHTCALLSDNSVKCWGYNNYGQLGLGLSSTYVGRAASEMGDSLPPVNLGTGKTAVTIATGGSHTCALLNDSSAKCWGHNIYGQLGLGRNNTYIGRAASDMGDSLPPVNLGTGKTAFALATGGSHTCALLNDSSVKCWGHNIYGQLGLGLSSAYVGRAASEMGDNLPTVKLFSDVW
ncbi:hypothetical protein WME90_16065 [Sorangium sp. So ce375]|uniref:RCC1 domain-containing protein n=1 Tax=Sorangium sp. So ce375 TaxID=3133306 RepID=UPI003F5AF99F